MQFEYATHSKYLATYAEAEEKRIRREIAAHIYLAFSNAGLTVTVSHDPGNETERSAVSIRSFLARVFADADYTTGTVHVFAYVKGAIWENKLTEPVHWVELRTENVADLICDYSMSAEKLLKKAKETANKYD